jgi:multidomain signaling protein FimX
LDTKILRLLIVDTSPDDTELTLAALRKGDFLLKPQRVHDLAGLQAAIEKGGWDAAISERSLPHFGAQVVLDSLRHANLEIPVLVLTRAIPDSEMTTLMRAGVRDVILKNQMGRLLPALERELAVATERAEHRAAMLTLKEMEDKHRAVVDGAREAICYSHDGMHIDANKAFLDMFEYESVADLEGVPVMNLIDKSDQARFKQHIRKTGAGRTAPEEFTAMRKSGGAFHAEIVVAPIMLNGEACTQILVTDISKRKAVETKLQYLNQHDALTGLHNRPHFTQALQLALESAKREKTTHGVVYIDFHDLHQTGKTLGPTAVDRFLLAVTRELREVFGPRAMLARYGDHEFTALVHNTLPAQLPDLAQSAEKAFSNLPIGEGGAPVKCACRVASGRIDGQTESAQALMASVCAPVAPATLTAVSAAVPAPPPAPTPTAPTTPVATEIARPALAAVAKLDANEWSQRTQSAIEHEAFRLIYQPIVNLHADAAEYFEVLVRMVADDGKLIPARLFMPLAEQSGQALAIDRWVVKNSIRALAELHRQRRKVTFFINLSAAALSDVELVVIAQQALHETGLKGKYVVFEVDESALTNQAAPAMAFMRAANQIGCKFCVDNFGRALGATTRLREPPVEYLKLDGALVQSAAGDAIALASLKAVVEVAKAMEKKTIAKSIESAESLSVLWTLGIDYVQGHYFQEADAELNYNFGDETTLTAEDSPHWTVASSGKSR